MPPSDTLDFCPIEQQVRDSSVLFALQRMYNDPNGDKGVRYTFDDIPSVNDYYQMRYRIADSSNVLIGAGVVATDQAMTHHVIYTLIPLEICGVFFTEDFFSQE